MKRRLRVTIDGQTFVVEVEEIEEQPRTQESEAMVTPIQKPQALQHPSAVSGESQRFEAGVVTAPLPGVITEVRIAVGDIVDAGSVLLTLEAMKMENEIYAPRAGLVKEVYVEPGRRVAKGDRLLVIS